VATTNPDAVAYLCCFELATYTTHYFGLSAAAAQYALFAFVLSQKRIFFRCWLVAQVFAGSAALLWVYFLSIQMAQVSIGIGWVPEVQLIDLPLTLMNLLTGYDNTYATWLFLPGIIVSTIGLFIGVFKAITRHKLHLANLYWLWLLILPLFGAFMVSSILQPMYVDRYFVVILPGAIILMLVGWQHLNRAALRYVLAAVLILSNIGVVMVVMANEDNERQDWRESMNYLVEYRQNGDYLLVDDTNSGLRPIKYYLADTDPMVNPDEQTLLITDLFKEEPPPGRIWVVFVNPRENVHRQGVMPDDNPFEEETVLSLWLDEWREHIVHTRHFRGITLFLLEFEETEP
jgi:hypothetical protein